ncbi:unnamed protein product [Rodentolepis nana]|uniref:Somatostatin domain-containing protein n=1 Tax=Rodentolepis nana TaxID=102285 RepID=A0A0R3TFT2_RODNA|nr:unnamed protein product [Rodentolepis nana]
MTMLALLTFGLLIVHSTTVTSRAMVSNRAGLASTLSREDLEAMGVEMLPPPDNLAEYAYLKPRMWDMSGKMPSRGANKRFFCNPWGCVQSR